MMGINDILLTQAQSAQMHLVQQMEELEGEMVSPFDAFPSFHTQAQSAQMHLV